MKKVNFLFNLIIASGVFMILGTAGGSDMGNVSLSEIFTFTISGIALISVGYAGKSLVNKLIETPRKSYAKVQYIPAKRINERNIAA